MSAHTLTMRLQIKNEPGILSKVTSVIGNAGGDIGAIDTVKITKDVITRDITIAALSKNHAQQIIDALRELSDIVKIRNVSNPIFLAHLGGKIEVVPKRPLKTRADLSIAYTPGVAEVSMAIYEDPEKVYSLTAKGNIVAIATDGTAVLGLGDIGPEAALPVMEGKAVLFKIFAEVDAFPICLATKIPKEIIKAVKDISPGFGGINLEDISAPRCFEIEEALKQEVNIPVFHDDQHGTAVVVIAGLINALKIVEKEFKDINVVINGVGAGGLATIKMLLGQGVENIIGCDSCGILYKGRKENMNPTKEWCAQNTNPGGVRGSVSDAMGDADVFIGLSAPDVLSVEDIKKMKTDPIVFALANPDPEIAPEKIEGIARIIATGRSDYPNQVNNALGFPGIFRGALDCRAREINEKMKFAAALAIAGTITPSQLNEEYIIPSIFDKRVAKRVAKAVINSAKASGVSEK